MSESPSADPNIALERARIIIRAGDLHALQKEYEQAREKYLGAIAALDEVDTSSLNLEKETDRAYAWNRMALSYDLEAYPELGPATGSEVTQRLPMLLVKQMITTNVP